jgi:pSer/pThr/pTyr-binding forkhead associated (FHA) protein
MVRLTILSGKKAGTVLVARHFPFRVGRSAKADLCLDEPGVWDRHLELDLKLPQGFLLTLQKNALAALNGQPFEQVPLRNGDVIEIGLIKIQFTLSETAQYSFFLRELLTWLGFALLFAGQIYLIYWLVQQASPSR